MTWNSIPGTRRKESQNWGVDESPKIPEPPEPSWAHPHQHLGVQKRKFSEEVQRGTPKLGTNMY